MKTKRHFSKFVSILFVLGLMLSNTGSVAYTQGNIAPAPEPVSTGSAAYTRGNITPAPEPVSTGSSAYTQGNITPAPEPVSTGSSAYTQGNIAPAPEPVSTELAPTEPPTTDSLPVEGQTWSQSGWFSIIWGDDPKGASEMVYTLTDDSGQTTVLLMIDETLAQSLGGILSFDRKYVIVEGVWAAPLSDQGTSTVLNVTSISLAPSPGTEAQDGDVLPDVVGSKPWVSIMCKFSDFAVEPKNLAFFSGMYTNVKPGLDHFWRELSYDTANVSGSGASGWHVLPHTEAYYNPTDTGQGTDLNSLATDCINAANPSVNFSLYTGINMMFNTDFDNGWAWGGSRTMTLDGVTKTWSTTWEPPWAYASVSVIAHEMGHGFGLPHSSGAYGSTYDNAWDVMSQDRYNCAAATDPTYGCMAQHTISYHKDILGWIPVGQKITVTPGPSATYTLEQLALPGTSNYKMVKIPIGGSSTHFYTVEARRLTGYDIKLAGAAVIIHEVDTTRSRPAYVIDVDLNNNTADAGAMWTVGETFSDIPNNIYVTVVAATPTGFQVSIANTVSPPGALQFSSAGYSISENGVSATITVTRTGGSTGAVGVSYATSNGTATAGSDYTSTSGTLSWANGDTANKTFSVPILDDSIYEGNETVNLTLSSPTGGAALGSPSTAVLHIVDNESPPAGITNYSMNPWASYSYIYANTRINSWVGNLDDGYYDIDLGDFDFQFYGTSVTNVRVSTNGYITFGTNGTTYTNMAIPNVDTPNAIIAPFWDDLSLTGLSGEPGVWWSIYGTAPNRYMLIEWYQIPSLQYGTETYSFEVILYESTDRIKFQYLDVDSGTSHDFGGSATAGIENFDGTRGVQYSFNGSHPQIINNLAIEFIPLKSRGDFNGDAKTDILFRNSSTGDVGLWTMNNTTITGWLGIGRSVLEWKVVGTGDFNGDGKTDILFRNSSTGDVGLWTMNNTTITGWLGIGRSVLEWDVVGTGDFNGDGKTDILFRNSSTGDVGLWTMNNTTITGWLGIGRSVLEWKVVGTGDFNGDGKTDILFRNSSTGDVGVWTMNNTTITGWFGIGRSVLEWKAVGTEDFNGDGKTDILFRNSSTGDVGVWTMNNTTITGWLGIGRSVLAWEVVGPK